MKIKDHLQLLVERGDITTEQSDLMLLAIDRERRINPSCPLASVIETNIKLTNTRPHQRELIISSTLKAINDKERRVELEK